ncbi:MAG TPA: FAD-dependent oxidoreductase [Trebonia sp.]
MKVIVIGAGIVGASIAYALARDGAEVTLIERGSPGGGASHASYAWVNSNSFDEPRYHALRVLSMAAYRELADELGGGTDAWLHETGSLRVAFTDEQADQVAQRVTAKRAAAYPAEVIDDPATIPALRNLPRQPKIAARYPTESYVDTTVFIGALLHRFAGYGGTLLRTAVTALGPAGVTTDSAATDSAGTGDGHLDADRVVVATGADTSLLKDAGFPLEALGPAGATVITDPLPVPLNGLIHFPDLTVRPDGGGRLLLHALDIDAKIETASPRGSLALDKESVDELTERASGYLGVQATAADVRLSFRPHPPDGFPVVGPVPGRGSAPGEHGSAPGKHGPAPGKQGAYVVCTHSGVTLAAILARLVSREIRTGTPDPLLAPYRPGRIQTP